MAEAKVKTEVTMKISATCPHHSRADVSVRDVETVIDEPTERGGTNLGLTPTETMVAALIGCTNVITNKIVDSYDMKIDAMGRNPSGRRASAVSVYDAEHQHQVAKLCG